MPRACRSPATSHQALDLKWFQATWAVERAPRVSQKTLEFDLGPPLASDTSLTMPPVRRGTGIPALPISQGCLVRLRPQR